MRTNIPHRRRMLCAAISFSLLPLAGQSIAQQEPEVEEVIVTGSFIRRSEGFTQASAVTQLSADDLQDQGTLNIGEVIQNLAFVNGAASAITNTIQGTSDRSSSIDLRGLGASSTLTLMDGKRLVNENVNSLIPTIAIQRMDIVADGAAALYGNEAVAGVVNFIPYKSYDGLKIDTYAEQDSRGDYDEHSVQMLWGGELGEIDLVLAGQFRSNSRLGWDERNELSNAGLVFSSNAPGNWYRPVRDANGQYTGQRVSTVDPNCGSASGRTGYDVDQIAESQKFGYRLGSNCWFEFGDNRSYREPTDSTQFFANATWDVSDTLTLSVQGFRSRLSQLTYTSTSNPGNSRIGELPAVRGEIPGNPFFAVDANGNQLYGVDANGDGIPDRGSQDLNGDGTPDYIVSGTTNNGILLREDVQARSLRPINKSHTPSDGHAPDMDNLSDNTDWVSRYTFQADFEVPFIEGWEGFAAYTHNSSKLRFMSNQNYDIEAMKQGLNCDVVNDREACYNPFYVVNEADNNSVQVMNDIAARDKEETYDELDTIDIVLNGEIPLGGFELPGGPIGAAVGYQYRDDYSRNVPSSVELAGDTWIGGTEKENITSFSRDVDAFFAEVALPLLPTLELTAAVRREEFSSGQESTDPKYGLTWGATDWLTFRATYGDAFIAPSLSQLFNPVTCGLSTVTDRFTDFSAFTTACSGGNPNLTNETSTSQQLGFDINWGDFDLSVTWNNTEFQNRIVGQNAQQKMELDFFNFKQATGFTGSGLLGDQPTSAQLMSWLNDPRSDKDIIRDPANIRNILQVNNLGSANAESVEVTAYDIQGTYRFSFDNIGDFRVGLQATFIEEFLYQDDPAQPIVDGAGNYNDVTGAAPELPEWKVNLTTGWTRGNHSVVAITRYIDAVQNYDGPRYTFMSFFGGTINRQNLQEIRAWTQVDANYTYRGLEMFDGEMSFTLGSRNLFDRAAQRTPEFAGVAGALQDPMGRVVYARLVYDF